MSALARDERRTILLLTLLAALSVGGRAGLGRAASRFVRSE